MEYSEGFRARMVQKMLDPAAMSACGLSRETGVPQGTLSRWLRKARIVGGMNGKNVNPTGNGNPASRRPQDWSAAEKLEAVLHASSLSDEDLGAFLRSQGLHEADLRAWQKTVMSAGKSALDDSPRRSRRPSKETKRIRQLEKELLRKEKALAEAAALLILQKKVQAIWGDEEGSTSGGKGS